MSAIAAEGAVSGRTAEEAEDAAVRARARRGLRTYFTVVVVVSAALQGWIIAHGGLGGPWGVLVFPLMYTPTLASVIARLSGGEGFGDVSFRWGGAAGTRAAVTAWLFPVVVGTVAYGIAWTSGLAEFAMPTGGMLQGITNPVVRFLALLPVALTVGTLISCLSAFGEEVGWRGYMVPRLVQAGVARADVVSGVIWSVWHVPLILWGGYAVGEYPLLSALLFVATVVPAALFYFRWRMTSGSVWPAVIAHGSWNVVIQSVFDPFTHGAHAATWTGESGVLTVLVMWSLFALMHRARWAGMEAHDGNA